MIVASTVSRILLGLIFTLAGILPLLFGNPPPQPGMMGVLSTALYQSHWIFFIAFAQFTAGVLLLVNRYVPVALIILAGFLYNSLAFHILTSPAVLPMPLLVLVMWLLVALRYRERFAPIFAPR